MSKDYLRHLREISPSEKRVAEMLSRGPEQYVQDRLQAYGNQAAQDRIATPKTHRTVLDQPRGGDEEGYGGRVALTFDDGPDLDVTPRILDILARHNIEATFFIHGERVNSDEARALLARMREDGHIVANHTMVHDGNYRNHERETDGLQQTADRIGPYQDPTHPTFARMPGGAGDLTTIRNLEGQGNAFVHWDVDAMDYCYNETGPYGECHNSRITDGQEDDMVGHVLARTGQFNGGILLLHDGAREVTDQSREFTAENLEDLILALGENGYSFTNLDDEQTFPALNTYARALDPAPYARNELIEDFKGFVDVGIEEDREVAIDLFSRLPSDVSFWSGAKDEVDDALQAWKIYNRVSVTALSNQPDFFQAMAYAIQAKQAFEMFRIGIRHQLAADEALGN
jgi:peptidoglycan/xylan/chitin deacetylase (PgdA/CDA1 family)